MCRLVTITFVRARTTTAARTVAHNGRYSLVPVEVGVAAKKEEDVRTIASIYVYWYCGLTKERSTPTFGQLQV